MFTAVIVTKRFSSAIVGFCVLFISLRIPSLYCFCFVLNFRWLLFCCHIYCILSSVLLLCKQFLCDLTCSLSVYVCVISRGFCVFFGLVSFSFFVVLTLHNVQIHWYEQTIGTSRRRQRRTTNPRNKNKQNLNVMSTPRYCCCCCHHCFYFCVCSIFICYVKVESLCSCMWLFY